MALPEHTEVAVVGGGHAGLCAAITAAELGCQVCLLESAPVQMRGGNTRHTRNLRVRHNGPVAGLTGSYSAAEYRQDLDRVTAGNTNAELADLTIEHSEALLHWLLDHGVRFQPSLSGTLSLGRTNAFFLGGGCALANTLYRRAQRAGVQVFYDCRVEDVLLEGHRCVGLRLAAPHTGVRLTAQSYIMASGGFQANETWMREAWGEAADNFLIRGTPYNQGQVLRALMDQGAATVGDATQCHAVAIDARAPKYDGGIVSRLDCVPFGIVVNAQAQRFYDEGEDFWPKRYAIWGRLIAAEPGQIAYAITDSKVVHQFMPSVFPAVQADDICALAAALELPPAALQTTVANYNAAVQPGSYDPQSLDDCRTHGLQADKTHWALPLTQPPFFAWPLRPGITFTYLGLEVDRLVHLAHSMVAENSNRDFALSSAPRLG